MGGGGEGWSDPKRPRGHAMEAKLDPEGDGGPPKGGKGATIDSIWGCCRWWIRRVPSVEEGDG